MKTRLKIHIKSVHGEKKFKCKKCDKRYAFNCTLNEHIRIEHQKVRSHKCGLCDRLFFRSSAIGQHFRTVHGERQKLYKCYICDHPFIESADVKKHIMENHKTSKVDSKYLKMLEHDYATNPNNEDLDEFLRSHKRIETTTSLDSGIDVGIQIKQELNDIENSQTNKQNEKVESWLNKKVDDNLDQEFDLPKIETVTCNFNQQKADANLSVEDQLARIEQDFDEELAQIEKEDEASLGFNDFNGFPDNVSGYVTEEENEEEQEADEDSEGHEDLNDFVCIFCPKSFSNELDLDIHKKFIHEKKRKAHAYACTICRQDLTPKKYCATRYQEHVKKCQNNRAFIKFMHKDKPYSWLNNRDWSCKLCKMAGKTFGYLLKHMKADHAGQIGYEQPNETLKSNSEQEYFDEAMIKSNEANLNYNDLNEALNTSFNGDFDEIDIKDPSILDHPDLDPPFHGFFTEDAKKKRFSYQKYIEDLEYDIEVAESKISNLWASKTSRFGRERKRPAHLTAGEFDCTFRKAGVHNLTDFTERLDSHSNVASTENKKKCRSCHRFFEDINYLGLCRNCGIHYCPIVIVRRLKNPEQYGFPEPDPHYGALIAEDYFLLQEKLAVAKKQLDCQETEEMVCKACEKAFSTVGNLRKHLRIHISRYARQVRTDA